MKKLFLVAALGIAGLMSAKDNGLNSIKSEYENAKIIFVKKYNWVKVITGCGKVFYLNGDDYVDCYECLQEDARKFTDTQCGEGECFELPY